MSDLDRLFGQISDRILAIEARLDFLERLELSHYKGAQAGDFDTTALPNHGDYGFQTADNEIQVNCNGTVRAIATTAL